METNYRGQDYDIISNFINKLRRAIPVLSSYFVFRTSNGSLNFSMLLRKATNNVLSKIS